MRPHKQEQTSENDLAVQLSEDVPRRFVQTICQFAASEKWDLKSKKKTQEELQILLTHMPRQNKVKYILLQWNRMPRILQLFTHCPFDSLKALTLGGNNIESLDPMARSNFQHLQQLWLWNNKITKLRCLRKMRVRHLRLIDLSSNCITQNEYCSEWYMGYLQQINLQKNGFGCINSMVKMESQVPKLRADIINNMMPSIIGWMTVQGRKTATYFYIRNFTILYR